MTVANAAHGVPAGQAAELTVLLMGAGSPAYIAALPEETRASIARGALGSFDNFPNYGTVAQLTLSEPEAYLLLSYTSWLVRANADKFRKAILG